MLSSMNGGLLRKGPGLKQHLTGLPALDCQANSEEGGEKQESVQAKHLEAGGWTGGGNLGGG